MGSITELVCRVHIIFPSNDRRYIYFIFCKKNNVHFFKLQKPKKETAGKCFEDYKYKILLKLSLSIGLLDGQIDKLCNVGVLFFK